MSERISLLDLTQPQLVKLMASWSQPRYRAEQVRGWIYEKLASDAAQMTNLPGVLRDRLGAEISLNPLELVHEQRSRDGQTVKWLFQLQDGQTIETVLMLYADGAGLTRLEATTGPDSGESMTPMPDAVTERRTVCISSQAGCGMGCVFCATGQAGLARNLTSAEIVAQVLAAARWLVSPNAEAGAASGRLTNVVLMGMGEPMANYERVWQALRTLTSKDGLNLGARHITLSTVGLPPGILRMAEEPLQINLAVSLHAPNDLLRTQLVPINHRYPLREVMAAVRQYIDRTHRRVTFEYALMQGINDSTALAGELATVLRGLICHVNLIPLNPVVESPYQPSTAQAAGAFKAVLERRGIPCTMRMRRGIDIDAGCGQLRRRLSQ